MNRSTKHMHNSQCNTIESFPSLFPLTITLVAFVIIVLIPKSLPALKIGSFMFGWGAGDLLLTLVFFSVFYKNFLRNCLIGRIKLVEGTNIDRAIMLYFSTLIFPLIIGIIRFPEEVIFEIASYIKFLEAFMIYYLIRKLVREEQQIRILLIVFIFVVIGVTIISGIQFFLPEKYSALWQIVSYRSRPLEETFLESIQWRLSGPFFNSNSLGYFLLTSIPLLWWVYIKEKKPLFRFFYTILIVASLMVLVFTGSRESYIGFVASFLVYIYFCQKTRMLRLSFFIIPVLIITVVYSQRSYLYHRTVEYTLGYSLNFEEIFYQPSSAIRIELWKASIYSLLNYWLTGIGLAQNSRALSEVSPAAIGGGSHNTYLRTFVEGGIINFVFFLYMLSKIWSQRKHILPQPWEGFNHAFVAGFTGLVVAGFWGEPFQNINTIINLFYLLGMIASIRDSQIKTNYELQRKHIAKKTLGMSSFHRESRGIHKYVKVE